MVYLPRRHSGSLTLHGTGQVAQTTVDCLGYVRQEGRKHVSLGGVTPPIHEFHQVRLKVVMPDAVARKGSLGLHTQHKIRSRTVTEGNRYLHLHPCVLNRVYVRPSIRVHEIHRMIDREMMVPFLAQTVVGLPAITDDRRTWQNVLAENCQKSGGSAIFHNLPYFTIVANSSPFIGRNRAPSYLKKAAFELAFHAAKDPLPIDSTTTVVFLSTELGLVDLDDPPFFSQLLVGCTSAENDGTHLSAKRTPVHRSPGGTDAGFQASSILWNLETRYVYRSGGIRKDCTSRLALPCVPKNM